MIIDKKTRDEFEKLAKPLILFLNNSDIFHPHMKIIITSTNAEVLEGSFNVVTTEYVKD